MLRPFGKAVCYVCDSEYDAEQFPSHACWKDRPELIDAFLNRRKKIKVFCHTCKRSYNKDDLFNHKCNELFSR